jgi:voltage-gated potassium channel
MTSTTPTKAPITAYQLFILSVSIWALFSIAAGVFLRLSTETKVILRYADIVACVIFLFDFGVNLVRAKEKGRYLVTWGWIDLLSAIPAVGPLRYGRIGRLIPILRVLRAIRSARTIAFFVTSRRAESAFLAAILVSLVLLMTASIAILQFEAVAGGNIKTAQDAMWWALSTMTTVGSSELYPVTPAGRLIGAFVMAAGVGVFGVISGVAASWFLEPVEKKEDTDIVELKAMIAGLQTQLGALRR